jgi:WhiB family redox-sensing transcriptional regulator
MWAGVKLPGGQYRKREQLAEAHATLRRIAADTAAVFHLPACQVGPRSAA